MIHGSARLVLPLVNHLVKESVNRLVPSMLSDMPAADHDLLTVTRLSSKCVMAEAGFHASGDPDGNGAQLATEFRGV